MDSDDKFGIGPELETPPPLPGMTPPPLPQNPPELMSNQLDNAIDNLRKSHPEIYATNQMTPPELPIQETPLPLPQNPPELQETPPPITQIYQPKKD